MNETASKIVATLGGITAVARIFGIKPPSVAEWTQFGIPHSRVMYLKVAHQQELAGIDIDAATRTEPKRQVQPARK